MPRVMLPGVRTLEDWKFWYETEHFPTYGDRALVARSITHGGSFYYVTKISKCVNREEIIFKYDTFLDVTCSSCRWGSDGLCAEGHAKA